MRNLVKITPGCLFCVVAHADCRTSADRRVRARVRVMRLNLKPRKVACVADQRSLGTQASFNKPKHATACTVAYTWLHHGAASGVHIHLNTSMCMQTHIQPHTLTQDTPASATSMARTVAPCLVASSRPSSTSCRCPSAARVSLTRADTWDCMYHGDTSISITCAPRGRTRARPQLKRTHCWATRTRMCMIKVCMEC